MNQVQFYSGINYRNRRDRTEEHKRIELPEYGSVVVLAKPIQLEVFEYRVNRGRGGVAPGVDRLFEKLVVSSTNEPESDFLRKKFRTQALDLHFSSF
jgi:hypothetical protein